MDVGFIGLGNLGEKLANSLLRNGINLSVIDLDKKIMEKFKLNGALICKNGKELAEKNDIIITCLPSPEISSKRAVLSLGFFIAIFSTAPWKTRKFLALTLIPNCSSSLR